MSLINRILDFNEGRLPVMLQYKYRFMTDNAFRFFRGTCHLFYEDLIEEQPLPPSPLTWICGDLHLENYGSFKGDNRLVYFDLNDFDEAVLAPCLWEVARMATSILLAFDTLGIEKEKGDNMVRLFLKTYADIMAKGKAYYIEPQTAKGIVCTFLQAVSRRRQKTELQKRTIRKKHSRGIDKRSPKYFKLGRALRSDLVAHFEDWIHNSSEGPYNYTVEDVAFRLAGTGSVGGKRYVFLLRSLRKRNKYLLVEMKQAMPSSLQPYISSLQPDWENEAQRVISIQKRMQNIPPALLSTTVFRGDAYIIQEMQPVKDSINFRLIKSRYRDIYKVIDDMAVLTASAQMRSSGRQGAAIIDELIDFAADKSWQEPVLQYAQYYAARMHDYYREYVAAWKEGHLFNPVSLHKKPAEVHKRDL